MRFFKQILQFFTPFQHVEDAHTIYQSITTQARHPHFYQNVNVADTPMGRYEMIVLHLFIVLCFLKQRSSPQAQKLAQQLANVFSEDLDHSLRALTLTETTIEKKNKQLLEGAWGRILAYDDALNQSTSEPLVLALLYNVYHLPADAPAPSRQRQHALWLQEYTIKQLDFLKKTSTTKVSFQPIEVI